MSYDPKFGWHATWITPLVLVYIAYQDTKRWIVNKCHKRKIKRILKENPDINELTKLSGINNDQN